MKIGQLAIAFVLTALAPSLVLAQSAPPSATTSVEAVAKSAYVYGFPMVDMYRIMYNYSIDKTSPAYKGPFNILINTANVYTPADKTVQTPNSDTPYSFIGLDLRAEPMVLTVPAIPKKRYYSIQYVDQYTFNIAYTGSRSTGNAAQKIFVTGPNWKGPTPPGMTQTVHFETQLGLILYRTQLFDAADLGNVSKIQAGYKAQPLSGYLHTKPPMPAPNVRWMKPLSPSAERTSPKFFDELAFLLQFAPVVPSEEAVRGGFSAAGIHAGKAFDPGTRVAAFSAGMTAGQAEIDAKRKTLASANDLFGTRADMKNDYLLRAVGAQWGILGNTAAEAVYLSYATDSGGKPLSGTKAYTIHYPKGHLPPARAFWSLTMYDLPAQLLVANPIHRYLINSPMLPQLKTDADGGITLYVQQKSPGKAKESNWLPAPAGPFFIVNRIYWPEQSAIDGTYKLPPMNEAQ